MSGSCTEESEWRRCHIGGAAWSGDRLKGSVGWECTQRGVMESGPLHRYHARQSAR